MNSILVVFLQRISSTGRMTYTAPLPPMGRASLKVPVQRLSFWLVAIDIRRTVSEQKMNPEQWQNSVPEERSLASDALCDCGDRAFNRILAPRNLDHCGASGPYVIRGGMRLHAGLLRGSQEVGKDPQLAKGTNSKGAFSYSSLPR
jgi:hypothetical protein